jgi:hypothetical protein
MKSAPLDIIVNAAPLNMQARSAGESTAQPNGADTLASPSPASSTVTRQSHIDLMDVVWKTAVTTTKLASLSCEGAALIAPSRSISATFWPDETMAWNAVVADVAGRI